MDSLPPSILEHHSAIRKARSLKASGSPDDAVVAYYVMYDIYPALQEKFQEDPQAVSRRRVQK